VIKDTEIPTISNNLPANITEDNEGSYPVSGQCTVV